MSTPLLGLELPEIQQLLGKNLPAYRARQVYDAIYRQRVASLDEITTLPGEMRKVLGEKADLGLPQTANRYDSIDGTRRYLLKLADDRTVETVLMPEESRDTLCISTQVGCPVNCRFCLTALMGLERNLTAGEIVGQVTYVAAQNKLHPKDSRINIVMMGQGEPLLNLPNVLKATRLLTDPDGYGDFAAPDHGFDFRHHPEDRRAGEVVGAAETGDFLECFQRRTTLRTDADYAQVSA